MNAMPSNKLLQIADPLSTVLPLGASALDAATTDIDETETADPEAAETILSTQTFCYQQ
jgi:hypothetical protein